MFGKVNLTAKMHVSTNQYLMFKFIQVANIATNSNHLIHDLNPFLLIVKDIIAHSNSVMRNPGHSMS